MRVCAEAHVQQARVAYYLSRLQVLKELFTETALPAGGKGQKFKSNKFRGVVDTFRTQLHELCSVLESSRLHFVRCFKPNEHKAANSWVDDTISRQLHTSGVLDALRVARTGYPDRMTFGDFASTFADAAGLLRNDTRAPKEKALAVLQVMEVDSKLYKVGKERIFLALGVLDALKTKRTERMAKVVTIIQAAARGLAARLRARRIHKIRAEAQDAMEAAANSDDIAALLNAISVAAQAGVGLAPKGAESLKRANATLQALKRATAQSSHAGEPQHTLVTVLSYTLIERGLVLACRPRRSARRH